MSWIANYFYYRKIEKKQERHVKRWYYKDRDFFLIDQTLLNKYIFRSPYRISKNYLKKQHADDLFTYGETPLITYEKIAEEARLGPLDRVLELGSGRGRGAFFLAHFYNCEVWGIERVPQFVKLADHVAKRFHVQNVTFKHGDMFEVSWPDVSFIYLYGTCLKEQEIYKIIERFKTLPKGTRILSVSYPIMDYDTSQTFQLEKSFPASFLWGETTAYLHKKI